MHVQDTSTPEKGDLNAGPEIVVSRHDGYCLRCCSCEMKDVNRQHGVNELLLGFREDIGYRHVASMVRALGVSE
jgi:hypothetical protein